VNPSVDEDAWSVPPVVAGPGKEAKRRPGPNRWIWGTVGAFVLVLGLPFGLVGIAHLFPTAPDTYSVMSGPVGQVESPPQPDQAGGLSYLMADGSPDWHYYPNLLPTGPKSTYTTFGGYYSSADPAVAGIVVDAVFAAENADGVHRGVFSVGPQALVDLVKATMHGDIFEPYPAGEAGAVLQCGNYATQPYCVWADHTTLILLEYLGTPDSIEHLAGLAPKFHDALVVH
jgi:hypothetical protein